MRELPALYHYTCEDGYRGILRDGRIFGTTHPLAPHVGPLVWLTTLAAVDDPYDVGLTREFVTCDRLARCFQVRSRAAVPWHHIRDRFPFEGVRALEGFGRPETWWVARRPLTSAEFRERVPA